MSILNRRNLLISAGLPLVEKALRGAGPSETPTTAPSTTKLAGQFGTTPKTPAYVDGSNKFQIPGRTGFVLIDAEGDHGTTGMVRQANATNGEMRFVLQRANADLGGSNAPFIIEPYTYGMSMSYGGTIQINTTFLQVGPSYFPRVTGCLGPNFPGGILTVMDENDTQALFITHKAGTAPPSTSLTRFTNQTYDFLDAGPFEFCTRGSSGFHFMNGPQDGEVIHTSVSSSGAWTFNNSNTAFNGQAEHGAITVYPYNKTDRVLVAVGLNGQTGNVFSCINAGSGAINVSISGDGGLHPGSGTKNSVGGALWSGIGAPATGLGAIGDTYFRTDTPTTANQRIYTKTGAGAWTGIV